MTEVKTTYKTTKTNYNLRELSFCISKACKLRELGPNVISVLKQDLIYNLYKLKQIEKEQEIVPVYRLEIYKLTTQLLIDILNNI